MSKVDFQDFVDEGMNSVFHLEFIFVFVVDPASFCCVCLDLVDD